MEAGEGGVRKTWLGKVTELTLGKDLQDHNQRAVDRALEIAHSVHCALCSFQFVRL